MGVKGLQWFIENVRPEVCVEVNLNEIAKRIRQEHPQRTPTIVVDAMSCLKYWYTADAWVHGGQWKEYIHSIESFIEAFTSVGIKLVFFFDGVVEQNKRTEWVRRRLENNREIDKIFQQIKTSGQQPAKEMFFIPSGLATFSRFALKSLGVETWCSLQEADYEIAKYGLLNNCMGILGQDSDYIIYDTAPYLSINKLQLISMTTVLYSRENLCRSLGLNKCDLPLLACILGNDIVSANSLQSLRKKCMALYQRKQNMLPQRSDTVLAVARYISECLCSSDRIKEMARLPISEEVRNLLERGIHSYLLPAQQSPWIISKKDNISDIPSCVMEICEDVLKIAREQHIKAEGFMVYNVLSVGEVECSNTLEDPNETELPGQAFVFREARQRIYTLLLSAQHDSSKSISEVKEWFVYPGNALQMPEMVNIIPLNLPEGLPDLKKLWVSEEPAMKNLRFTTFLALFDLHEFVEEISVLEPPVIGICCLLIYISRQVDSLSIEDIDAYLSQAICVRNKPLSHFSFTEVHYVDTRAVQLASLFIRGLTVLIAANTTCGFPFKMAYLMPWEIFDGIHFHSKYLKSHAGCSERDLLEENINWISQFHDLKVLILKACEKKGRIIQSKPRKPLAGKYSPGFRAQNRKRFRLAPRWPQNTNFYPGGF
ncbi:constitutive coactivator of peroxisome proliferator-activated receptor gamma isoform X3 [Erpetoichthys calabaricus]|uniref:constitutive coactivator of peroxisome proliferator-activated receptor gamma isoform X3 n=1 Tax=Erpetoichthys calabaricus TaxID=27687 RepID=UPI002234C743|nr:constitutive coactivator of peroxisome proliferator-activated receptor gamma isoform X3 [Erpetoichthys calabaricus]